MITPEQAYKVTKAFSDLKVQLSLYLQAIAKENRLVTKADIEEFQRLHLK